jgi:hypothetical protein
MKQKINFDDLKRLHDGARIAKVGSREWIEFATTVLNEFPTIYSTAKGMNEEFHKLRNQVTVGKQIVQQGIEIMDIEQLDNGRALDHSWNKKQIFIQIHKTRY